MDKLTKLDLGKWSAVGFAGAFVGAAYYVNIVDIPSSMKVEETTSVLAHWRESFQRARRMQASLAILSSASAAAVYYYSDSEYRWLWLVGSGLIATVVPYTKFVMMGDINKLLKDDVIKENGESWVRQKISLWNKKHMFRTAVSDIAYNFMLLGIFLTR